MKFFKPLLLFVVVSISITGCKTIKLEPVVILTFQQKIEKLFPNAEVTKMELTDHFTRTSIKENAQIDINMYKKPN